MSQLRLLLKTLSRFWSYTQLLVIISNSRCSTKRLQSRPLNWLSWLSYDSLIFFLYKTPLTRNEFFSITNFNGSLLYLQLTQAFQHSDHEGCSVKFPFPRAMKMCLLPLDEHGLDVRHFSPIYRVMLLAKFILSNWFKTPFLPKKYIRR